MSLCGTGLGLGRAKAGTCATGGDVEGVGGEEVEIEEEESDEGIAGELE